MKKRHWVVGLFIAASLAAGGCSSPTQQAKGRPGGDDELVGARTAPGGQRQGSIAPVPYIYGGSRYFGSGGGRSGVAGDGAATSGISQGKGGLGSQSASSGGG